MSAETVCDAGEPHADPQPARQPTVRQSADQAEPRRVICYSLRAAAEPGIMPRVLELFAKRNLVPERWHSDVVGPARDELSIDLQVGGLDPDTGAYIARCLRQIWGVEAVLTSEKRFA